MRVKSFNFSLAWRVNAVKQQRKEDMPALL